MAEFEVINALTDLDRRTPLYFKMEIFCHSDRTAVEDAIAILSDLGEGSCVESLTMVLSGATTVDGD